MAGTKRQGIGTGKAIIVVFVVGLLFVCVFVDLVTCPQCEAMGWYEEICPECDGSGEIKGQVTCQKCWGFGFKESWESGKYIRQTCPECDGLGKVEGQVICMKCFGSGNILEICTKCRPEGKVTVLEYLAYKIFWEGRK